MTLASILACREPWRINIDALRQELQSQFGLRPNQLQLELSTSPDDSQSGAVVVKLDDTPMAITVHKVPLPMSHWIYGPQPNLFWPDAESALRAHKSHIRILLLEKPKDRRALIYAVVGLNLLATAVCRAADAIGVLWCPSDNLLSAKHFIDSSCRHFEENISPMDIYT